MSKVRIVGGGLTGVLAAFEARRQGAQDIEIIERFEELGGELLPLVRHGLELRDRCFYFGGPEDPARRMLEWGGARFQDFETCGGSVGVYGSPDPTARTGEAAPDARGETLADRLRALPIELEAPLSRYCQWRLRAWLDEVHESAAGLLGVAPEPAQPRLMASLPRDGFADLFRTCRRSLEARGVKVRRGVLASARELLLDDEQVTVWAADPAPLFQALGFTSPARTSPQIASYVFKASFTGPHPFVARNFTAVGSVFRVHVYECRGESLASVECVAETPDNDLRREVQALMTGIDREDLVLGDCLSADLRTASNITSMDCWRRFALLRCRLADLAGGRFVAGPWRAHGAAGRLAELSPALADALAAQTPRRAAA